MIQKNTNFVNTIVYKFELLYLSGVKYILYTLVYTKLSIKVIHIATLQHANTRTHVALLTCWRVDIQHSNLLQLSTLSYTNYG